MNKNTTRNSLFRPGQWVLGAGKLLGTVCLSLLITVAMAMPGQAVTHRGPYWSWEGPANWTASYGAYGITVFGKRGARLDLRFSSTLCSPGNTWDESVANYFASQRQALVNRGWRLTSVSGIFQPPGTSAMYKRQRVTARTNGKRGVVIFDYDFSTYVSGINYCYKRSLSKTANRRPFPKMIKTLNRIERSLAYSGPGA
jgi:hypothetical protein